MKNIALNQWLDGCGIAPGMLGSGVRLPDGTCLTKNFNETWPSEQFDQALPLFAGALTMLSNYGFVPRWLTWTFAQGQIRIAAHSNGLLLALATEPNTPAAHNLDQFTEEFLALDFGH
ncbi:MAG TPA: hypothetical protein VGM58_03255 [Verrucomicrobiae bacterium]|jgi:hypothetical protein